jgi:hypothetical protein
MKFTIVIPTREGGDTLASSLRACLDQDYDGLEVLVSDNASSDDTRDVVLSFHDSRLRYVNTGRRVSMTANWEFALQHVKEGYLTIVGDDDAMLPGAVAEVSALIGELKTPVLAWKKARYHWPTWGDELTRDYLFVPAANRLIRCGAKQVARDCARLWLRYDHGPCLYNSFADVAVLRAIQERCGNPILYANDPDCYSTFAIASQIESYWYSTYPFSVNGGSSHSNGGGVAALLGEAGWNPDANATAKFVKEIDVPPHADLPAHVLGSVVAAVIETALYANERCFGGTLPVDVPALIPKIVREARNGSPERYTTVAARLRDAAAARPELRGAIEKALRRYPNVPAAPRPPALGVADDELTLRTTEFGVTDVYAAAQLVRKLLGPYRRPATTGEYNRYFKLIRRGMQRLTPIVDRNIW